MYDIDFKLLKKNRTGGIIFIIFGLLFTIIMIWLINVSFDKVNKLDSKIMSTRVEIKQYLNDNGMTAYTPIYYYFVNGKEYTCSANASTNVNPGTDNNYVYYDSNNPAYCNTEYSNSSSYVLVFSVLIPIGLAVVGLIEVLKWNKKILSIKKLNNSGKLIKGLNFTYETVKKNDKETLYKIVVPYTKEDGSTITLYGDERYDSETYQRVNSDNLGTVDILINPNNLNEYYIDYEINRLGGNKEEDYKK